MWLENGFKKLDESITCENCPATLCQKDAEKYKQKERKNT